MKKQTASNNNILSMIKFMFNSKIYKNCCSLMNDSGEESVKQYLQQFTTTQIDDLYGFLIKSKNN